MLLVDENTKFSELYSLFLSQIKDYEYGHLTKEEFEITGENILINSLLTVQELSNNMFDIDIETKSFNRKLELSEKLLIAKAMKLTWVRDQKYRQELMRKSIGDRDYKAVQGTDYLRWLTSVEKELYQEIRHELLRYSWRTTGKYSELRGG